jgi:hypothetical protein
MAFVTQRKGFGGGPRVGPLVWKGSRECLIQQNPWNLTRWRVNKCGLGLLGPSF